MGLYDTPAKDMGRLSYEMWRATRLVVDTGMHAKGWTKEQAVEYMTDNTALSAANIEAEVNRYIADPGAGARLQDGRAEDPRARARAEKQLGDKFDLRRFHDAVLGQGAVPLDTLDAQINAWIAAEKARSLSADLFFRSGALCRPPRWSPGRACLTTCTRQPVKPAGPTGEQLLIPVAPTVSRARALLAQASRVWRGPPVRSFSGIR